VLKAAIYFVPALLVAQTAPTPDGLAYFETNIRPLLAANCYACHSTRLAKPMGDLLLDSRAGMLRGGKSGAPAIVPGKPEESLLLGAVLGSNKDLRMPPGKSLTQTDIEHLAEWIRMGAPDPRTGAAPPPAPSAAYDWDKAKQHWAFRPVQDPKPPAIAAPEWSRSPIDASRPNRAPANWPSSGGPPTT
jgi:hypothetical protein